MLDGSPLFACRSLSQCLSEERIIIQACIKHLTSRLVSASHHTVAAAGQDAATEAGVRSACLGVATALEEVATAADEGNDDMNGMGDQQLPPAPQRFAAAVQASIAAAQAAGADLKSDAQ